MAYSLQLSYYSLKNIHHWLLYWVAMHVKFNMLSVQNNVLVGSGVQCVYYPGNTVYILFSLLLLPSVESV